MPFFLQRAPQDDRERERVVGSNNTGKYRSPPKWLNVQNFLKSITVIVKHVVFIIRIHGVNIQVTTMWGQSTCQVELHEITVCLILGSALVERLKRFHSALFSDFFFQNALKRGSSVSSQSAQNSTWPLIVAGHLTVLWRSDGKVCGIPASLDFVCTVDRCHRLYVKSSPVLMAQMADTAGCRWSYGLFFDSANGRYHRLQLNSSPVLGGANERYHWQQMKLSLL